METATVEKVLNAVNDERVVRLTQNLISIPSPRFEEEPMARYLGAYMAGIGMDVELQEVPFAWGTTMQVIGRYRGTGGGPTLLMCSHMDSAVARNYRAGWIVPGQKTIDGDWYYYGKGQWTKDPFGGEVDDEWIYGVGAVDQKGGVAAMVAAVAAIKEANIPLKGDIIVFGTAAEGAAALGAYHAIEQGLTADYAIITEFTNLDIVTISVGVLLGHITVDGNVKVLGRSVNPIVKMYEVINALTQPIEPGGWLTFESHPDLPGFPRLTVREIESTGSSCTMLFDMRLVPGMTEETVRADLNRLLESLQNGNPELQAELKIPAEPFVVFPAAEGTDVTNPLVQSMAQWHQKVIGQEPVVGAGSRLGGASDTPALKLGGIKNIVEYGPGSCSVWPMIDECCRIEDIVNATKVLALTAVELCG